MAREDFLRTGPWQIVRWGGGYRTTPDPDPVYLYTDVRDRHPAGAQPEQRPALASCGADRRCCAAAREHVVHVGAGVGYYTAILAELVDVAGRVTAIEFDAAAALPRMVRQGPSLRRLFLTLRATTRAQHSLA